MPRLSRWFIRASLIYLGVGFFEGSVLLFNSGTGLLPAAWYLLPSHIEFLLVGWIIELCLGMAFWILPRYRGGPPRGNESLAWAAFGLFNAGVLLAASAGALPPIVQLAGRIFEALGAIVFAAASWGRLKPLVIPKKIEEKMA